MHGSGRAVLRVGVIVALVLMSADGSAVAQRAPVPVSASHGLSAVTPPAGASGAAQSAPRAAQLDESAARVAAERRRWEARRASPEARRDRADSQRRFAGQGVDEALATIEGEFANLLGRDAWRPLHGLEIKEFLSDRTAVVASSTGDQRRTSVVESTMPLRTRAASGAARAVDLELRAQSRGWSPEAPLVALEIGSDTAAGVSFPDAGIRVVPRSAQPVAGRVRKTTVIYPNSATDTDFLAYPLAMGAEAGWVLRSRRSPERLELDFDLPPGARLEALGDDGLALAQVVGRDGELLAVVRKPLAQDADGAPVTVSGSVADRTLILSVAHHTEDLRYPLYVDPYVYVNWAGCLCSTHSRPNLAGWFNWSNRDQANGFMYSPTGSGSTAKLHRNGFSFYLNDWRGGGLYISSRENVYRQSPYYYDVGYWKWHAPDNAFIYRANFMHAYQSTRHGAFVELGITDHENSVWEGAAFKRSETNTWTYGPKSDNWGTLTGGHQDHCVLMPQPGDCTHSATHPSNGNGMKMTLVLTSMDNPYANEVSMLAADAFLSDRNLPTVGRPSTLPRRWYKDGEDVSVSAHAHDDGLGVRGFELTAPGGDVRHEMVTCLSNLETRDTVAPDDRSACPRDPAPQPVTFNTSGRPEGLGEAVLRARDVVEHLSTSDARWPVGIDRSAPRFDEASNLPAQITNQAATVEVTARDGDPWAAATAWRSGVKKIEVFLTGPDGVRTKVDEKVAGSSTCTVSRDGQTKTVDHSCPMTKAYRFPVDDAEYRPGAYVAEFVATDWLGQTSQPLVWNFIKVDVFDPTITALEHGKPLPPYWVHRHESDVFADAWDPGFSGLYQLDFTEPLLAGQQAQPPYRYRSILDKTQPCEGNLASPCPIRSRDLLSGAPEGTRSYDTDRWREGIVTAALQVRDAAGHTSKPPSTFQLKVDRSAPVIDTPTGDLWARRNRDDDHRYEGLYGEGHAVTVIAHDGSEADRRSGVKQIKYELVNANASVVDTKIVNGSCDQIDGCGWDLTGAFSLRPADFPDGEYTVRITAVDQLDHAKVLEWKVTIDLRGDVYRAGVWTGNPGAGGELLSTEGNQLNTTNTHVERLEDQISLSAVRCAENAAGCLQSRQRTLRQRWQTGAAENWSITTGTSPADARLTELSTLLDARDDIVGEPQYGTFESALEPWQRSPAGHDAQYRRYSVTEQVTVDGEDTTFERVLYVDNGTLLPLKREFREAGELVLVQYFTYPTRLMTAELPGDYFALTAPSPLSHSSDRKLPAQDPQGAVEASSTMRSATSAAPAPPRVFDEEEYAFAFRRQFGLSDDPVHVYALLAAPNELTVDRWGTPLDASEAVEMNLRRDVQIGYRSIAAYTQAHAATFAGSYFDPKAGLLYIGFTNSGSDHLEALKLLHPIPSRLRTFSADRSLAQLSTLKETLSVELDEPRHASIPVSAIALDEQRNAVVVVVRENAEQHQATLRAEYGPGVIAENGAYRAAQGGSPPTKPFAAGLAIDGVTADNGPCTAGFTAKGVRQLADGRLRRQFFKLTAGHCVEGSDDGSGDDDVGYGTLWQHWHDYEGVVVGRTGRVAYPGDDEKLSTDAAYITLRPGFTSALVYLRQFRPTPTGFQARYARLSHGVNPAHVRKGFDLCQYGQRVGRVVCGDVEYVDVEIRADGGGKITDLYEIDYPSGCAIRGGDSGGPVFRFRGNEASDVDAFGLIQAFRWTGTCDDEGDGFQDGGANALVTSIDNVFDHLESADRPLALHTSGVAAR